MEDIESEVILDTDVIIDYLKRNPDPDSKNVYQRALKTLQGSPLKYLKIVIFLICP